MLGKATVAIAIVAALLSATPRLDATTCMLTNTPGEKACQADCCYNKVCCDTSHQRTGAPVQPLAKSTLDQQTFAAPPVAAPVSPLFILAQLHPVSYTEPAALSPPRLSLLCTFLI